MKQSRLSNFRKIFLVTAAAAALGGVLAKPCLAEGGQLGAYEDALRQYQALLQDPNLDPSTRQQLETMIQTLRQQEANMQSLNPSPTYGSSGPDPSAGDNQPPPPSDQYHPNPNCDGNPDCVMSAQ
jgi:hypothetical protein